MMYVIEVYVYSILFLAVYAVLLRSSTAYAWSRAYLLAGACLPLVLPLIQLPESSITAESSAAVFMAPVVDVFSGLRNETATYSYPIVLAIYVTVAVVMIVVLCRQYLTTFRFLRSKAFVELSGNVRLITGCGYGPGSFGRYVFFPDKGTPAQVLQHELAHIAQRHSADVLFIRVLQCFFWPNIFLYLVMRELRAIHEFQADIAAAGGKDEYARTLLNSIFHTNRFSLSHTFFNHPIKRRIIMLQKKTKSRSAVSALVARTVIAALLPVSCMIYLQSCSRPQDAATSVPAVNEAKANKPEQQQVKPEAGYDLAVFMQEHIKYPRSAEAKGIEGKVIVGFTVDEHGRITAPEVVKSPDAELSAEAMRVVKLLPDWKPTVVDGRAVAAKMYLPVSFKL